LKQEQLHLFDVEDSTIENSAGSLDPSSFGAIGLDSSSDVPLGDSAPLPMHSSSQDSTTSSLKSEPVDFVYDESDRATVIRLIHENIAIGMISTEKYHSRIMESMNSWWNYEEFKDVVTVFSDTANNQSVEVGRPIANVIDTGCESTYNYGIWCKNTYMLEYWRNDPKFLNVKWFVRAMDDTYLHLENILNEVSKHDHREKVVIGEKWCKQGRHEFPVGGSGFIFSRAVLYDYDWSSWSLSIKNVKSMNEFIDDMVWGEYLQRRGIEITHHGGVHQFPMYPGMPLYRYWMQFHSSTNIAKLHPWNMDFRPLLLHHQGLPIPMQLLHQNLHELQYTPVLDSTHKDFITIPKCVCNSDRVIRKCYHSKRLLESGSCHRPDENMQCIAPATWKWYVTEYEFNPYALPQPQLQAQGQAEQHFGPQQSQHAQRPQNHPHPQQQYRMVQPQHEYFLQQAKYQQEQQQQQRPKQRP